MDRTFFDVHMHAMDLSHPNLLAFVGRIKRFLPRLILSELEAPSLGRIEERVLNLLTVMESNIEDYFILMEYFLKNRAPAPASRGIIRLGNREFDTIILIPLIIDFGYKSILTKTFYNMALGKPVAGQTVDVLNAIRRYCTHEVVPGPGNSSHGTAVPRVSRRLLEIYPFLGINPSIYEACEMTKLLRRCFDGYAGRRDELRANMGSFAGDIDKVGSNVFAGIKLYPPLGFDPWPDGRRHDMAKVKEVYAMCESKQIPLTVHCSELGFTVAKKADDYTDPRKWRNVLKNYPGLKLNLAHFGHQQKKFCMIPRHRWRERVVDLILSHDNVYTDISCLAFDDEFYRSLDEVLQSYGADRAKLTRRILFGSDYMIHLLYVDSYNEYLDLFLNTRTKHIDDKEKGLFCSANPAKFLFLQ